VGLTSGSIPNFVNGVSQQAISLRLSSQAEAQVNCFSTILDGLKKRPPTRHLANLGYSPASSIFAHIIDRDADERYVVLAWEGDLAVYDLSGVAKTVAFPDGKTYLQSTIDAATDFSAASVADYTFWINKQLGTSIDASSHSPARPYEALVNVKQGNYGKTYAIDINGTQMGVYTAPNSAANQDPFIDTSYIVDQLVISLAASNIDAAHGWIVTAYGNALYIARTSTDFTISVKDGFGGNAMTVGKGTVQHFSDLPSKGPDGFVIEVVGDSNTQFDNFYVKLDAASGTWKETVKPDIEWAFAASSMPHALVRESDGTFTYRVIDWSKRLIGDTNSAEQPSFIGRQLRDVFFHRNRLGFLCDENVILSRAGDFFNFWPKTATTVLDDDPIDVGVSHTKVSILHHAVPFRDNLVLFSDQTQFSLHAQLALTPKTVAVTPTTELPCSQYAKPAVTGDSVFFTTDGGSVRVYEYRLDPDTQALTGEEVTSHVPHFIPGGTTRAEVSSKHNDLRRGLLGSPQPPLLLSVVQGAGAAGQAPGRLALLGLRGGGGNPRPQVHRQPHDPRHAPRRQHLDRGHQRRSQRVRRPARLLDTPRPADPHLGSGAWHLRRHQRPHLLHPPMDTVSADQGGDGPSGGRGGGRS
jgi:hypothetical protein